MIRIHFVLDLKEILIIFEGQLYVRYCARVLHIVFPYPSETLHFRKDTKVHKVKIICLKPHI